jgi:biopolymer transport protein TolR
MAAALQGSGSGGSRRRRGKRRAPIADINMTPFIDVILVLLIIFMVSAPLMTVGVPIDLPKTGAGELNVDKQPVTVSIDTKGAVFLGEEKVALDALIDGIEAKATDGFEERIYVRADRTTEYGTVARVMALITEAGFKKVALVTEQEQP